MLKRLIERGAVVPETQPGEGRRRYAAAEPPHCIGAGCGAAAGEPGRLLRFMDEFHGVGEADRLRLSSQAWETGLALLEAERAPRELPAAAGDACQRRQAARAAL